MNTTQMRTEEVFYTRGADRLHAYGAWLRRDDRLPAVVIIPDVRGLTEHFRDIARRYASEGLFALAVDLYSREGTPDLPTMEAVFAWMRQLDDRRVLGDIEAAVRFLAARPEVRSRSIGVTGFCMGGQYALMAACSVTGVAACVSFYGMLRSAETSVLKPASPLELAPQLGCPYLGLFGAEDALIPAADVRELESILRQHGKTFQLKTYEGAGHAFFNDTRPDAYRPTVAQDAWNRAVTFFRTHLEA